MLRDSRADTLSGKFHHLRFDGFNVKNISAIVEIFQAKNLVASNINIYEESSALQINSISSSSFETATLNFTNQLNIVGTNFSRLGVEGILIFKGTNYQTSNIIAECNFQEMGASSVVIERGAALTIQNTIMDSLGSGAIVLTAGSSLHLQDLVIRKANYGAIFVIEPSQFSLNNVTFAGRSVRNEGSLIHRINSNAFLKLKLSEEADFCPVKNGSATCDLAEYSEVTTELICIFVCYYSGQ